MEKCTCQRTGEPLLWRYPESFVQPAEEKGPGRPFSIWRGFRGAGKGLWIRAWSNRTRRNGFKLMRGMDRLDIEKKSFTVAQVSQKLILVPVWSPEGHHPQDLELQGPNQELQDFVLGPGPALQAADVRCECD